MALQLGEQKAEEKAAGLWKEAQEGELGTQLLGLPTSALASCVRTPARLCSPHQMSAPWGPITIGSSIKKG